MDILLDAPVKRLLKLLDIPFSVTAQAETDPGVKVFAALLYIINYTADGSKRSPFKWYRLPPWSFDECQPRVQAALLERLDIVRECKPDRSKVFRRLPDLKSELSNFSSLDLATREAWEFACRDVLQAQAPGEVNIMQISREPVSAEASEWWPKVVAAATKERIPRRKRCLKCKKKGQDTGLLTAEQLDAHFADAHPPRSKVVVKEEPQLPPAKRLKMTK
ncbi:hypothetical protein A1Q2_06208 [Trichosporon asahii var. asahii CBS 8904]|uniref:Uncharacterized protein n=1 Tax=Trichosporon asahii var. asahii (strain CBS 8904) TaxID=1220162 RepID=K1VJW3_TRIAC|nr:hypothetical protein A1Q2_06208 [Trichosporon asahii var. asahii CBS 8904]